MSSTPAESVIGKKMREIQLTFNQAYWLLLCLYSVQQLKRESAKINCETCISQDFEGDSLNKTKS